MVETPEVLRLERDTDRPPEPGPISAGRIVRWLALTAVLWIAAAGYLAYDAQGHARNAEASLRRVADVAGGDLAAVDFEAVEADLGAGRSQLEQARHSISSPIVGALGPVPVLGRQLRSAEALIVVSDDLAGALQPLVASARAAQDEPNALDRVAFLRETSEQLGMLQSLAAEADLGPSENLVGPLFNARQELSQQLAELAVDAAQYETITMGLASFFDDSTYLVLGANNAEMQIGGGMPLSVGRVAIVAGDFELPGLLASAEQFPVPVTPVVDSDVQVNWGWLNPSNDFRKLNYSMRFNDFGGPQALDMWEAQTGERLDGVLMIDPFVLDAILSVVGEVEVEGEVFDSGGALSYLLQEQYAVFDDGDDDAADLTDERRDRLSLIANAAVDKLATSSWDPIELLEALRPLAGGRHIMLFSDRAAEQLAWSELGVAGEVPTNGTSVVLINNGGSKLDPFMTLRVNTSVSDEGDERRVSYDIEVENRAPAEGLPRYTVGPWRTVELDAPGTYFGQLAVLVPGYVSNPAFADSGLASISGPDGSLFLTATRPFSVAPGSTASFTFEFALPASAPTLRLIPSARFPAAPWTWRGEELTDRVFVDLE